MKYATICSGIEAVSEAWKNLPFQARFFSEIEPFPCAVLNHHYPNTPNFGDMEEYEKWKYEKLDIIVAGTPCQSFSIAGLRKGMDDPRGNLTVKFAKILNKFYPQWFIWENVPGILSSNKGRDFAGFLGLLSGTRIEPPERGWKNSGIISGYKNAYGLAYRTLDAQYFGVPQRRRRVFVVGYLGDWRRAAAVLFEFYCLQGHSPPSRKKGERIASTITKGFGKPVFFDMKQHHNPQETDTVALTTGNCNTVRGDTPLICHGTQDPCVSDKAFALGRNSGQENVVFGLPGNWIGRKPENGANATEPHYNVSPCLTNTDKHAVAFTQNTRDEVAGSLSAQPGAKQQSYLRQDMQVRRLTPVECERLQGFPDNYTHVKFGRPVNEGQLCGDGHRYKALGNSMAVPVMKWLGQRILTVEAII